MQEVGAFSTHQLRHSYAAMLYDADVDILTAQKLSGHADAQTTIEGWNNYVSQL